jgi:asparagine synthase (glutamine-hydrolysing)
MGRRLAAIPVPLRALVGLLAALPPSLFEPLVRSGPKAAGAARLAKGLKVAANARGPADIYRSFLDHWAFEPNPVLGAARPSDLAVNLPGASPAEQMMLADALGYLPDDILCKVDRASMAVSLETRVPFLDHRLAAVAARVPLEQKIAGGRGKLVVRRLLSRYVPETLTERPKAGFGIPVGQWLQGPLREWAGDLLSEQRLRSSDYFDPAPVRRRFEAHLAGRGDSSAALWAVLMFESWLEAQR